MDATSGGSWFHYLLVDGVKEFWCDVVLFGGSVRVVALRSGFSVVCVQRVHGPVVALLDPPLPSLLSL